MSGSGLHLTHILPWNSLVDLCSTYKHPYIKLPVCESGKIHITNKKVKHQLKNKLYLHDKICHGDCEVNGEKYFRKSYAKKTDELLKGGKKDDFQHIYPMFFKKFRETILQFIETIDPETTPRTIVVTRNDLLGICDECNEITHLIETKDIGKLNSYTLEELKNRFGCHHTQAIGRNLSFLFHHVLSCYLLTNIIYASGQTENPDNWGRMKPKYRRSLMYPCDGQTFPPSLRQYLKEDVYLKDFDKMKELCKRLFEFIYIYTMLELKIGKDLEIDTYDSTWIIGI